MIFASFWPINERGFVFELLSAVVVLVEINIMRVTVKIAAAVDLFSSILLFCEKILLEQNE